VVRLHGTGVLCPYHWSPNLLELGSPFTKVAWIDIMEAVAGGTAAWYGCALPVPLVAKPSGAWLCGLFDSGILATCKSSLLALILPRKCPNL
jgi:hypothetical protein